MYPINEAVNLKMPEVMIVSVIPTFKPSPSLPLTI